MTRLGDFLNILATNFLTKVAEIFGDFWGYFKYGTFQIKTSADSFFATIEKIGLLLISTIGHTARKGRRIYSSDTDLFLYSAIAFANGVLQNLKCKCVNFY